MEFKHLVILKIKRTIKETTRPISMMFISNKERKNNINPILNNQENEEELLKLLKGKQKSLKREIDEPSGRFRLVDKVSLRRFDFELFHVSFKLKFCNIVTVHVDVVNSCISPTIEKCVRMRVHC
uniref:Uncharacterized protein n=1 Tax=Megaselia scalaris TaxID=36166 RepID=T1GG66_MEGSC